MSRTMPCATVFPRSGPARRSAVGGSSVPRAGRTGPVAGRSRLLQGTDRVGRAGPLAGLLLLLPLAISPAARAGDDPAARMTVTGHVLDPQGKPVPGAAAMVIVQSKLSDRPMLIQVIRPMTAHQGRCDGSGRFHIELPRTSSAPMTRSMSPRWRRATASAGRISTRMRTRPPPTSRFAPSNSSGGGCSTCRASRRGACGWGSSGRSRSVAATPRPSSVPMASSATGGTGPPGPAR